MESSGRCRHQRRCRPRRRTSQSPGRTHTPWICTATSRWPSLRLRRWAAASAPARGCRRPGGQFGQVAHRAVDHHAGPAVPRRGGAEVAAEQGAAQRAAAVDHQHPALAGRFDRRLDQRVVLEALHGGHRPGKACARRSRGTPAAARESRRRCRSCGRRTGRRWPGCCRSSIRLRRPWVVRARIAKIPPVPRGHAIRTPCRARRCPRARLRGRDPFLQSRAWP